MKSLLAFYGPQMFITTKSSILVSASCVHYHVHKSLPLGPILNHLNLVNILASYLLKIHLNIPPICA